MYSFVFSKLGIRVIGALFLAALIFGAIYEYHYKPINELTTEIKAKDTVIQDISNDYVQCTDTLQKLHLEGYINGISDINDTAVVDLNNLHT